VEHHERFAGATDERGDLEAADRDGFLARILAHLNLLAGGPAYFLAAVQ